MKKAKNNYEINGVLTKIILTNKKKMVVAYVLIDTKNLNKCIKYRWCLNKSGYSYNNKVGLMHNYILERNTINRSIVCDHIDQNKLNNLEENLRIVTQSVNMHNCGIHKDNTSGFRGVTYIKNQRKKGWRSRVTINGKTVDKFFYSKEEAVRDRIMREVLSCVV